LIVKGNVQGVGYRALVKFFAGRAGIKGLARNLEDGSVEIFVDGSKGAIEGFMKMIHVRGRPEEPLSLHVDEVETQWEGEPGYRPPWREYRGFQLDYGAEELTTVERETLESLEWSKLHFWRMGDVFREELRGVREDFREEIGGVRGGLKDILADIKEMHGDLRDEIAGVRGGVRDMHTDMNRSFEEMARRYDAISAELVRTREELTRAVDGLLKLIEEFIRERHGENPNEFEG